MGLLIWGCVACGWLSMTGLKIYWYWGAFVIGARKMMLISGIWLHIYSIGFVGIKKALQDLQGLFVLSLWINYAWSILMSRFSVVPTLISTFGMVWVM